VGRRLGRGRVIHEGDTINAASSRSYLRIRADDVIPLSFRGWAEARSRTTTFWVIANFGICLDGSHEVNFSSAGSKIITNQNMAQECGFDLETNINKRRRRAYDT
jgi:hypothetical protein